MIRDNIKYAGFFARVVASLIDGAIFVLLLKILTLYVDEGNPFLLLAMVVLWVFYTALFLSSPWSATVGKKILGIKVLSVDGKRLSFKHALLRSFYALFSNLFILPVLIMFFTSKRQALQDLLAKCIVVDIWTEDSTEDRERHTYSNKKNIFRKIIIAVGMIAIFIPTAYMVFYMSVMYTLYSSKETAYNNSFHQTAKTNDYNDSRIRFYDEELHQYSRDFIDAQEIYTIFEADVKRDLALGCIQYFVRRYDDDVWINMGSSFRRNARNSYANTEEKIEKAKENESFMGHNFYTYDTNMVNDIEDDITKLWSDSNESVCEQKQSVDVMYETFIFEYLDSFISQNINGHFAPSEKEQEWYTTLQSKFPDYFENIKRKEAALAKEIHEKKLIKIEESKRRKKVEFDQAIEDKKDPFLAAIWFEQNQVFDLMIHSHIDLNRKDRFGRTPLFIAVQVGNKYALQQLLKNGADMYVMDVNDLYTVFTELLSHPHIDMKMVNLFLEYGYEVNFQHNASETALSVAAKGCKNIELLQLLLQNGADPHKMDRYRSNTLLKVQRGCKKSKNYDLLIDLLE